MSRRREQLSLTLERTDGASGEGPPPEAALLQALAELLLEAYGQETLADPADLVPRESADER